MTVEAALETVLCTVSTYIKVIKLVQQDAYKHNATNNFN
jgi:hypothetical protein